MDSVDSKNKTGDRKTDSVSFQRSFVPTYKDMLHSMMCDVLAHVYGKHENHFVVRRPVWVDGVKKFQYGHLKVPHESPYGIVRYGNLLQNDPKSMWDGCYEIYLWLKSAMFSSLASKEEVKRSIFLAINDELKTGALSASWKNFQEKSYSALDKK